MLAKSGSMTSAEIDAMPAGPEMDASIAAFVMRLDDVKTYPDGRVLYRKVEDLGPAVATTWVKVPSYSTSDAAALEVLKSERLAVAPAEGSGWAAGYGEWYGSGFEFDPSGRGDTPALAICRAALKAVYQGAGPQP